MDPINYTMSDGTIVRAINTDLSLTNGFECNITFWAAPKMVTYRNRTINYDGVKCEQFVIYLNVDHYCYKF